MTAALILIGYVAVGALGYFFGFIHGSEQYIPFDEKRHLKEIDKNCAMQKQTGGKSHE